MNNQAGDDRIEQEFDLDGFMRKRKSGYWLWLAGLIAIGLAVWIIPGNPSDEDVNPIEDKTYISDMDSGDEIEIALYLPNKNQTGLMVVPVLAPLQGGPEERIELVIDSLLDHDKEGYGIIPLELIIKDIFVSDTTAVISVDGSLKRRFRGGAWTELIVTYSLVNTVIENFDFIKYVKILVDDKDTDFFVSHVSASAPFTADLSLVAAPSGEELDNGVVVEEGQDTSDENIEPVEGTESEMILPEPNRGEHKKASADEGKIAEEKIKL